MKQSTSLFREQALKQQSESMWGSVLIRTSGSYLLFTVCVMVVAAATLFFLFANDYTRKQTVNGYISPDSGIVKVYANQPGYFDQIHVQEQSRVFKGEILASIANTQHDRQGNDIHQEKAFEIDKQKRYIAQQIENEKHSVVRELENIDNQMLGLKQEIELMAQQYDSLKTRSTLADNKYKRAEELLKSQVLSKHDYESSFDNYLQVNESLRQMDIQKIQQNRSLDNLKNSRKQAIEQSQTRQLELETLLSQLNTEAIQLDGNNAVQLTSPITGVVTGIQVRKGDSIKPQLPVLSILPEGHHFIAYLYVPTRAIGRLDVGQTVRFKYDAFPYQKYGIYHGHISDITQNIFRPDELDIPVKILEPSYRITVVLDKQDVKAFGKSFALQAGMTMQADVIYDKRSLIEWLLEPLYSLKG